MLLRSILFFGSIMLVFNILANHLKILIYNYDHKYSNMRYALQTSDWFDSQYAGDKVGINPTLYYLGPHQVGYGRRAK